MEASHKRLVEKVLIRRVVELLVGRPETWHSSVLNDSGIVLDAGCEARRPG